MKISKCCKSKVLKKWNGYLCTKCNHLCDTIEQPMQHTPTPMQKDKQSNCSEGANEAQAEIIKAYERGFIEGANLTGSQAKEELEEQKQNILELIYKEINKTTKNGKDSRGCKCLENIYQKIIKLK